MACNAVPGTGGAGFSAIAGLLFGFALIARSRNARR
jgi:hypothetical protein